MFSLARALEDSVEINGEEHRLDLSFDNVLLAFEVLDDESIYNDIDKVYIVLKLLFIEDIELDSLETMVLVYKEIMERVISAPKQTNDIEEQEDIEEVMDIEREEKFYDLHQDAQYIYASFLQDYGMDLFDQQGRLHWKKFNALLMSLSDNTMFKKVIAIRQRKITKEMSKEERQELEEQQRIFALNKSREEIEFEGMDLIQKQEYALKMLQEGGG
ncbi:bacteriophage Gp15 family protein [Bacillus cereus]|uniref:Gp15 family bacteriophage protein n=1 Tax=Bacillus cereus TaxID=1396 RepID=UPI0020413504|nr:Gp15 family bacteriophage protein [Bacillus cereus]MCM3223332.1 bacteriophage Gp15 family protein [Bacillus cereus]